MFLDVFAVVIVVVVVVRLENLKQIFAVHNFLFVQISKLKKSTLTASSVYETP